MAGKTSIANPVVVLGLDAGPFTAGLEKAKVAGTAAAKKISDASKGPKEKDDFGMDTRFSGGGRGAKLPTGAAALKAASGGGLLGGVAGAGGGLLGGLLGGLGAAIRSPIMPIIAMNQAMEFAAKITKTVGAPIRAMMAQEQLQAQFSGTGTVGAASMTAGIERFGMEFNAMLAQIAIALDETFDIKGKLEWIRGAMSGVSELIRAFMTSLGVVLKDPDAMKKMFAAGQKALIDGFETAGVMAVKIANYFIGIYKNVGGIEVIFGDIVDTLKIAVIQFRVAMGLLPKALGDFDIALLNRNMNIRQQVQQGKMAGIPLLDEQVPVNIANQARAALAAKPVGAGEAANIKLMEQARVIAGKIGGDLAPQIANKIAPLMASGSAQLEDALVKAQLQGEAGDIQKRIEAAIQQQLAIQTQQAKTLERIRQVIAADPGLAILGNN